MTRRTVLSLPLAAGIASAMPRLTDGTIPGDLVRIVTGPLSGREAWYFGREGSCALVRLRGTHLKIKCDGRLELLPDACG